MSFDLNDKDYYLLYGLFEWKGDPSQEESSGNMLIMVSRPGGKDSGERWKLQYRFRYYRDHKAFDSDDRRAWYGGTLGADVDEDEIIQVVQDLLDKAIKYWSRYPDVKVSDRRLVILKGGMDNLLMALEKDPNMNMKRIRKGDPEWEKYEKDAEPRRS